MKRVKGRVLINILHIFFALLLFGFFFISVEVGTTDTSLIRTLLFQDRSEEDVKVILIRLSQSLAVLLSGISLSVSGLVLQRITKNNLADPGITGVLSGSVLGITIMSAFGVVSFLGFSFVRIVFSFIFGLLAGLIFTLVSSTVRDTLKTLIFGVMLNSFISGLIILVQSLLDPYKLQQTFSFLLGSVVIPDLEFLLTQYSVVIAVISIIVLLSRKLDVISLGDTDSHVLGINIRLWRTIFIVITVVMSSTAVSLTGVIGFVGFVIPNVVTMLSYRFISFSTKDVVILSSVIGGIFLTLCYIVARKLIPFLEIPLGVITGLIGAPIFAFVLFRLDRSKQ